MREKFPKNIYHIQENNHEYLLSVQKKSTIDGQTKLSYNNGYRKNGDEIHSMQPQGSVIIPNKIIKNKKVCTKDQKKIQKAMDAFNITLKDLLDA